MGGKYNYPEKLIVIIGNEEGWNGIIIQIP
jgi:hypothetical protein